MRCSICLGTIAEDNTFVGTGDGSGQSFAHKGCYDNERARAVIIRLLEMEQQSWANYIRQEFAAARKYLGWPYYQG